MCGLAGSTGYCDVAMLTAMAQSLRHRGPDAQDIWQGEGAGLAHARLSIQDLGASGAQPMVAGDAVIAFNGEIYNAPDLHRQLVDSGHQFRGHSDTEVIVRGYAQWGSRVIEKLDGMFAFALWDMRSRSLLLARDRIGIKPLYYAHVGDRLIFGSEIKALFCYPELNMGLSLEMVDAYLALGYIPEPDTIFAGVRALLPGQFLLWHKENLRLDYYWTVPQITEYEEIDELQAVDALDYRLNEAVSSHLLADVEIGAFLSGGVDSSLVAAIAARQTASPLRTFTIGFAGGGDERPWAKIVAEHIGSRHQAHVANLTLVERLPQLLHHLEQPLFDNSILPTFLVSQVAAKDVKVVLAGDGGDEPFFGYDWVRYALSLPRLSPIALAPSGWEWAYRSGAMGLLQRGMFDCSHSAEERYLRRISTAANLRYWLYCNDFRQSLKGDPLQGIREVLSSCPGVEKFPYADLRHYLPRDVLFKVDRMSMAHGLEVRVPLLDHHLLEWELALPVRMRFRHGRGKYLLRKVAARYLPSEILAPRKQGFTIPIGRWLREGLGLQVEEVFRSNSFAGRGVIEPEKALQLLMMHRSGKYELGHRIWSLFMLEVWFREWQSGVGCSQVGGSEITDG
ncbi:MAG: asparagine synthase (glutamine-hydrolyzing) [Mariprofundales bacterium]